MIEVEPEPGNGAGTTIARMLKMAIGQVAVALPDSFAHGGQLFCGE
jgi:hypothetical protein